MDSALFLPRFNLKKIFSRICRCCCYSGFYPLSASQTGIKQWSSSHFWKKANCTLKKCQSESISWRLCWWWRSHTSVFLLHRPVVGKFWWTGHILSSQRVTFFYCQENWRKVTTCASWWWQHWICSAVRIRFRWPRSWHADQVCKSSTSKRQVRVAKL